MTAAISARKSTDQAGAGDPRAVRGAGGMKGLS